MKRWILTPLLAATVGCTTPEPSPAPPPQPTIEEYELSDAGVFFKIDGVWYEAPPPPGVLRRVR